MNFTHWCLLLIVQSSSLHYKPQLAIKLRHENKTRDEFDRLADTLALEHKLVNHGQVGELVGHYLFSPMAELDGLDKLEKLEKHPSVAYFAPQVTLVRDKRAVVRKSRKTEPEIKFNDPEYPKQWHLHNSRYAGSDCNVTGVWANNITGKGVIVAVVDDGVQWNHQDLVANYAPEGSFDLNSNDNDPMPEYDSREENKHGTRCAGEIAAAPNDVCGVGVAFGARFSGIRVLDGPITDSMEATAFNKHLNINDVYSCSWGPEDDARTLDGPHPLAQAALIHGVTAGRRGFGSIYIVASGNGGAEGDNCNFDGYANSIYTITIGAVDEKGDMPYYAEECASMLASTFSSGLPSGRDTRKIVTTDWTLGTHENTAGCTDSHTGTSAATPLAAGMVALMLEVRPCLTWRDIQHIIAFTARKIQGSNRKMRNTWTVNGAGFEHSTRYGFGVLDGWRLVNAAKIWQTVPMLTSLSPPTVGFKEKIRAGDEGLTLSATVLESDADKHRLHTLENVQVTLTIEHGRRGDIEVIITCPSGTKSLVGPNRARDDSKLGFKNWTFSTVRCWGESPVGTFHLTVRDRGHRNNGFLKYWQLQLYGSSWTPEDIARRRRAVEHSYSGEFISPSSNFTVDCPEGTPQDPFSDLSRNMSDRSLKLMALMSGRVHKKPKNLNF